MSKKYRLVTRSDFDGLVCAALLKELDMIDDILFVHPKDVTQGKIAITENDITTNVPYTERCFMAFDHHASEGIRLGFSTPDNLILDQEADSAAHVVYDYYGGRERFCYISTEMLAAVDKADAARFTEEEILNPEGWVLLSFIMDPRTGLGRFRDFTISNYQLMMKLIDYCREHPVDEILELPDVLERVKLYFDHADRAKRQIRDCATVHGSLVVVDYRDQDPIYCCNRFMVYALFPQCNISIHALRGREGLNTIFALGHSILNRTSAINIGELALRYEGGGHVSAGTCQVENEDAERVLAELIEQIEASESSPIVDTSPGFTDVFDTGRRVTSGDSKPALKTPESYGEEIAEINRRLDRLENMVTQMTAVVVHE